MTAPHMLGPADEPQEPGTVAAVHFGDCPHPLDDETLVDRDRNLTIRPKE